MSPYPSQNTASGSADEIPDVSLSDFREKFIANIVKTIEDKEFISRNSIHKNGKGFTRNRKISFIHLIVLLTQGLSRSIQRELNSFYQKLKNADFSIQQVTKSAFTHARAKLKPEAFIELNQVGIDSFYKEAPYLKWHGFRLLSIDGSTAMLPNHPSVVKEFGVNNFGPNADKPRSVARISMLYDVLNLTTLDAQISSFQTGEQEMARWHLPSVEPGQDLLIMDRGYPSISLMFELQKKGIDYCIRLRDKWWKEAKKMLAEGETDKLVQFKLPEKDNYLLKLYKSDQDDITCRLVAVALPDGETAILCTSVKDIKRLPHSDFSALYHLRWNIEEAYKLYKCRIQLESFSGKTAQAVKQDFHAKVFMMTTTAVLAFPVEEKLKKEQEEENRKKHKYKVNRTNALSMFKEVATKVFINKKTKAAIKAFDRILKATVEIVRPNRKVPRNKTQKKPPSMNYKDL